MGKGWWVVHLIYCLHTKRSRQLSRLGRRGILSTVHLLVKTLRFSLLGFSDTNTLFNCKEDPGTEAQYVLTRWRAGKVCPAKKIPLALSPTWVWQTGKAGKKQAKQKKLFPALVCPKNVQTTGPTKSDALPSNSRASLSRTHGLGTVASFILVLVAKIRGKQQMRLARN